MIILDIQHTLKDPLPVTDDKLNQWVEHILSSQKIQAELTLRFVDKEEIQDLNRTYRQQDKPTNVLAFPANLPDDIPLEHPLLGDVIICPEVLAEESQTLSTTLVAHWAHIVTHGILHLLGYDHIKEKDALVMESLEIDILKSMGFENPYLKYNDTTEDGSIE